MDVVAEDKIKHQLYDSNSKFRALVDKHRKLDSRLSELTALTHPTESELEEEHQLKKRKLAIKDMMHLILEDYAKIH